MSTRMKSAPSQALIMQTRDEGKLLSDAGVFEVDLIESRITWANDYAVSRSGYTLDQMRHMTVLEVIPGAFRGDVQEAIAEIAEKKTSGDKSTSIWPMQISDGKIIWWAVLKTTVEYPLIWVYGDHIQTTGHSGMSFVFMKTFMQAAKQTALCNQIAGLKAWAENQIEKLSERDDQLSEGLTSLEGKMEDLITASKNSTEATKESIKTMEEVKATLSTFINKYDAEILKLIGTDSVHDKKIEAFEKHAHVATELAMKSIEMQAIKSSESLTKQAEESSKGISRKVVIPVSVIAGIVTIIQILVERLFK